MADDTLRASPKNDQPHLEVAEDAETRATRRELKQSSISDTPDSGTNRDATSSADDNATRPDTPADGVADVEDEDLKDQISSPKKKRAHDQLDAGSQANDNDANSVTSTDSAKDRALRLEPEKKRHRDEESGEGETKPLSTKPQPQTEQEESGGKSPTKAPQGASTSAFAASGFGKLATSSSPFANLGAGKDSAFGTSTQPSLSSFASLPAGTGPLPAASAPKLTFGGNTASSPFAGLSSSANGFGSGLSGTGFGSALSGVRPLGSFAAPGGNSLTSAKPARPFGAPESDVDDDDEEVDGEGEIESQSDDIDRGASPEKESDEKRKLKLQKIEVDDGEAGEATIVSVRAKMFYHDKEAGWKERGAGMLKINAPQSCIELDDAGAAIPGSFDASGLEVDEEDGQSNSKGHRVVRLLMRQDQTHRVILNTAIVPAMKFQEKTSLKSVGILFTAFEGPEANPVSVTMRLSAANAKIFLNEISVIQRELRDC